MIFSPKSEIPASVKARRSSSVCRTRPRLPFFAYGCPTLSGCHHSVIDLLSHNLLWDAIVLWTGATGGHDASRISDPIANSVSRYLSIDIENLFAICFAAVVQGGILLASAYLFHLLLKNRSQKIETTGSRWLPYFVSTILLLLLPISIVFSYGARLEWQIGPEQKETIQASGAYSDATSMMNTLKGMIAEERQRLSTNITELPAFRSWMASMDQLSKAVAHAPDAMRSYLKFIESAEAEKRSAERSDKPQASQQDARIPPPSGSVKSDLEAIAAISISLSHCTVEASRHDRLRHANRSVRSRDEEGAGGNRQLRPGWRR